jgi:hypothetical protein
MDITILIIGAGWYGCHIASILKEKGYNIIIIDKQNDFFGGSSYSNQNRLHLGYHYPRSKETIDECKDGYIDFMDRYKQIVEDIPKNMYFIDNSNSLVSYDKYISLYEYIEEHNIENIYPFDIYNVHNTYIRVNEKYINHKKAKKYFKDKLQENFIYINNNKIFESIDNIQYHFKDNNIKYYINCTYNHLNPIEYDTYELVISYIYKIRSDTLFAYTLMDGDFFSLFPHDIDNNLYTLTHVSKSVLWKGYDLDEFKMPSDEIIDIRRKEAEQSVLYYLPDFLKNAEYIRYNVSWKTKPKSTNDDRSVRITMDNNIINVYGGKITGIFSAEKYILNNI